MTTTSKNNAIQLAAEESVHVLTIVPAEAAAEMGKIVEVCLRSDLAIEKIAATQQSLASKTGFAAETLHAETLNLEAILQDRDLRAYTDRCQATPLSKNHPVNDIVIVESGEAVSSSQLKFYKDGKTNANELRRLGPDGKPYYGETDSMIVPSDQLNDTRLSARRTELKNCDTRPEVAEAARDVQKKVTDRLEYDGVESRPMTKKETETIAKGGENGKGASKKIQNEYKNRSTIKQTLSAAKSAAIATAVISGTINTISCLKKVQDGSLSTDEAVRHILTNTGAAALDATLKAAAGTAAVSLVARSVPEIFSGSVLQANLAGGAVAGAAICAVDLAECLVLAAAGRMTMKELEERTGKNIFQTGAGVVGSSIGAAIGAPAGPVGIFVCSTIGGMITSVAMTVAIENGIEKPFQEVMEQTDRLVRSEHMMADSVQLLEYSQTYFRDFRIGCAISEQQFEQQMAENRRLGLEMWRTIGNI